MSERYELVKKYYDLGYWSKTMVWNAVGKWITPEEYKLITGEDYQLATVEESEHITEDYE